MNEIFSTPVWVHRCMIVPDTVIIPVRQLADSFGPIAQGMWITPLSPTGQEPPTHWISAGLIDTPFANFMPFGQWTDSAQLDYQGNPIKVWTVTPPDPAAFIALCESYGITDVPTQEAITALFSVVDVSEEQPFTAMERLGLKLIQAEQTI